MTCFGVPLLGIEFVVLLSTLLMVCVLAVLPNPASATAARLQSLAARVLFCIMCLSGAAVVVTNVVDSLERERLDTGLPAGAVVYEGDQEGRRGWKKWRLGSDCYISRDLGTRTSAIAPTRCPSR